MFHHVDAPEKIIHISDQAFFEAVDLDLAGLGPVRTAIQNGDFKGAFSAFWNYFLTREKPRDPFVGTRAELLTRISGNRELAEVIVGGGLHTFGQVTLDFSKQVDFNANFGDQSKYGFHYLIWMEPLPHAALETGDISYIETYLSLIRHWYDVRDQIVGERPMHPVFYELGLSGRSRRFLDFLYAIKHLGLGHLITPDDAALFFKSLLGAARWLLLEQTTKGYRNGNWQMHGVWGLLTIGYNLPELAESKQFRAVGADYLEQHMEQDYDADGGHSERCYSYGTGCLRHLSDATRLMEANPDLVTPQRLNWRQQTEHAYRWFLKMTGPAGAFPGLNDGTFSQSHALLKNGFDFTGDPAFLHPIRHLVEAEETTEPDFKSIQLESSGFCVMRQGWDPDDPFLLINHGSFPGGHSHMGILDFNLYAFGVPLAAEVGRFGPYDGPWDMFFRSEQAHNQVVVEGAESRRQNITGEQIHFGTASHFDFFSGQHSAYKETAQVLVERRVLFLKPWGVLISDTASSPPRRKSYLWYLHSVAPFVKHAGHAVVEHPDASLLVVPADKKQLHFAQTGIDYEESMILEIPMYGGQNTQQLWPNRYFMALRGWHIAQPITPFDVLLCPYKTDMPVATLSRIECTSEGDAPPPLLPRALEITTGDRTLVVLHGAPGVTVSIPRVRFTGLCAAIEFRNGQPFRAFTCEGEALSINGEALELGENGTHEIDLT